ncbi:MAG: hypothetical protein JO166_15250 [Deltaproteobacteria bacterium]|nr:hypothetical protein [Deltaproteobacteria bacterium]
MNLRDPLPRQSSRSRWPSTFNHRGIVILAGLLLLLAGFSLVTFLLNFDQLQRLAEESNGTADLVRPASDSRAGNEIAESRSEAPPAPLDSAEVEAWLVPLNHYRAMVGLAPVTADPQLSRGDLRHSHYLAVNYGPLGAKLSLGADAHTEDPAKPAFTADGAAAARASDIDWSWNPHSRPKPSWAIGNWMQVPFHRMQIINPYLPKVGYGSDCQGVVCFAALNTGSDVTRPAAMPELWPRPVAFPPDGSVMPTGQFSEEWPSPLTSCPGYVSPAGLPITLELGYMLVPDLSDYSVTDVDHSTPIEACAFNADTYVNPDTIAQTAARAILREFGAIIVMPRQPLSSGRYAVSVTAGKKYSWAFHIGTRNLD